MTGVMNTPWGNLSEGLQAAAAAGLEGQQALEVQEAAERVTAVIEELVGCFSLSFLLLDFMSIHCSLSSSIL